VAADLVGTIEPAPGAVTGKGDWIALVAAHPSLALHDPVPGINPFTKAPMTFKPHLDHARVLVEDLQVGSIHWALDGATSLMVWAEAAAKSRVIEIASDVAARLGWRFVAHAEIGSSELEPGRQ
jgi:hypothetical protein